MGQGNIFKMAVFIELSTKPKAKNSAYFTSFSPTSFSPDHVPSLFFWFKAFSGDHSSQAQQLRHLAAKSKN
jgi:hypothetical protein